MKGDFTRNTFHPHNHFTRVLMQQGRVQLDADWNEQVAILLHYLQTLAADLIGPYGGPVDNCGFGVVDVTTLSQNEQTRLTNLGLLPLQSGDFLIGKGHYYVDGMLCENEEYALYSRQPDMSNQRLQDRTHLVYLDVWERHITCVEDEDICEDALGGPDTATRARVIWQVKTLELTPDRLNEGQLDGMNITADCTSLNDNWQALVRQWWQPENRGHLKAKAKEPEGADLTDPCITPPEARYRGAENQLYRVEIHEGGTAGSATFKWSWDNGSVVFPLRSPGSFSTSSSETDMGKVTDTMTLTLEHLGRDSRFSLGVGDWVELVDDDYVLGGAAEALWQVDAIDRVSLEVTLIRNRASTSSTSDVGKNLSKHPLLRRWDHREGDPDQRGLQLHEGAALIVEGKGEDSWLLLEDGVQIQFQKPDEGQPENRYRTGDYWLIPARTATGDVEWPGPVGNPEARPPHGVEHHYAPLAIIQVGGGAVQVVESCRRELMSLWEISKLLKSSPPAPPPEPGGSPARRASRSRRKSDSS